jgi:uncharacterized protein YydD (DUF2326 family)
MNKMIQDMSKQMSMHLESQKVTDKDSKDRDSKVIQRYKKQIHDLNTELQTERALHKITAASLQSLEEDCVRLRQQYQAMRRRNNSASDKYVQLDLLGETYCFHPVSLSLSITKVLVLTIPPIF